MTDRELLEQAAKAAGITWDDRDDVWFSTSDFISSDWNPLTDDGDALRLAVKLGLSIAMTGINGDGLCVYKPIVGHLEVNEAHGSDPYAATRRAIVRAAAEIGKGMK